MIGMFDGGFSGTGLKNGWVARWRDLSRLITAFKNQCFTGESVKLHSYSLSGQIR